MGRRPEALELEPLGTIRASQLREGMAILAPGPDGRLIRHGVYRVEHREGGNVRALIAPQMGASTSAEYGPEELVELIEDHRGQRVLP